MNRNAFFFVCFLSSVALAAPHSTKTKAPTEAAQAAPVIDETDPNIANDNADGAPDAVDNVDKPILKPIVTSQPAPMGDAADTPDATTDTEDAITKAGETPEAAPHEAQPPAAKTSAAKKSAAKAPVAKKSAAKAATHETSAAHSDQMEIKMKPAAPKAKVVEEPKTPVTAKATAAPTTETAAPVAPSAPAAAGVTADQSLKWLTNGNLRFVNKKFRADGKLPADRVRVSKEAQHPHAIVLACSDSRVPPELIFDQGLGEITTIRVAGEVLDSSVIASIETAILNEHPHLLVVLGHTQCESIETALRWKESATNGSDALDRMVAEIKPHFRTLASGTPSAGLQVESVLQADGVARDLAARSDIIKKAVDAGDLTIKTGLYWIDTGQVKFY